MTQNPPNLIEESDQLPDRPTDPVSRFLGMVSPEAMQEALDELGYSISEHIGHVITLVRDDNPKVKAAGLSLFESMHERRLRHSGHTRHVTVAVDDHGASTAFISSRGIDHGALPGAPAPIPGVVVYRPSPLAGEPVPGAAPSGGSPPALPPG